MSRFDGRLKRIEARLDSQIKRTTTPQIGVCEMIERLTEQFLSGETPPGISEEHMRRLEELMPAFEAAARREMGEQHLNSC